MRVRLLIPALVLSTTALSLAAQGDAAAATHRTPRRTILAGVGALVGRAGGAVLHHDGSGTACRACTIGAGALIGSIGGLLIGREIDQAYALRYRGITSLDLTSRTHALAVATSTGL